jgi:SAM-dependent methyltransferase
MYQKSLLDLGCGQADIGGAMYRLGADVTALDSRQEHLTTAGKKFAGIKVVKADLDRGWPFQGRKFDVVLDLALLCHLRDYEAHLIDACSACRYLILETAVCDSNDPNKCVMIKESKFIYDNSSNGFSARPSAAAIERVLNNCGFSFQRMDSSKLNTPPFIYDWQPRNDDGTNINHRRLWFAEKINPSIPQIAPPVGLNMSRNPHSPYEGGPINGNHPQSPYELKNSHQPAHNNKPLLSAIPRSPAPYIPPSTQSSSQPSPSIQQYTTSPNSIQERSRLFSITTPDKFITETTFTASGIILPLTLGARMWYKKISPFFPNLQVQQKALAMQGFTKNNNTADLIMCSITHLAVGRNIWIEEWAPNTLTSEHFDILKNCPSIMTPSLLNMQEILKVLPNAHISRVIRPWPLLNVSQNKDDYFIYLESDPALTQILLQAWQTNFGTLVVVGASAKLPSYAQYISDHEEYPILLSKIVKARALIHLNKNTHYLSGIEDLARAINLPIITNNECQPDNIRVINISQGQNITSANINQGITKFLTNWKASPIQLDLNYNNILDISLKKMLDVLNA